MSNWMSTSYWIRLIVDYFFKAIFEAQEETITHLKIQLRCKDQTIDSLEQKLKIALMEKETLNKAMRYAVCC